jgi:serine/threonine protein kinase
MACPDAADMKEMIQQIMSGHAQGLGEGSFGKVFKLGNYVVKRIDIADSDDMADYNNERRVWRALTDYGPLKPYLPVYCGSTHIDVHIAGQPIARAFIFQIHEPVRNLLSRLGEWSTRPLDAGDGLQLFNALVSGFNIFHNAGYIHRDIKPANILIRDSDLSPIIVDFGLTCKGGSCDSDVVGTMSYIPQNLMRKNDEDRVDVVQEFPMGPGKGMVLVGRRRTPRRGARAPTTVHVKLSDKVALPTYNRASDRYSLSLVLKQLVDVIDWAEYGEWKQECEDLIRRYRAGVLPFLVATSVQKAEGGRRNRTRRRHKRSGHKRSGHKRSGHKRSGHRSRRHRRQSN